MTATDYHRPPRDPDFEAEINALKTEEGGRMTPMRSGYRPSHDFGLDGILNDAQHEYIGTEILELGKKAMANLWLLCPEYQEGRLFVGMEFTVQEGSKIVGRGKVVRVLNKKLEKPA